MKYLHNEENTEHVVLIDGRVINNKENNRKVIIKGSMDSTTFEVNNIEIKDGFGQPLDGNEFLSATLLKLNESFDLIGRVNKDIQRFKISKCNVEDSGLSLRSKSSLYDLRFKETNSKTSGDWYRLTNKVLEAKVDTRTSSYLRITNVEVYGLNESIKASALPMLTKPIEDYDGEVTQKDLKRARTLARAKNGSGHDNFLKGITVQFDIEYPEYWSPQFQRYHFADIVSSMSKMHRLTKTNLKVSLDEFVSKKTRKYMKRLIKFYNEWEGDFNYVVLDKDNEIISVHTDVHEVTVQEHETYKLMNKTILYEYIMSNLPSGYRKTMRITTNYLQLKSIYYQRKGHKLLEWEDFCNRIENLPLFSYLMLSKDDEKVED